MNLNPLLQAINLQEDAARALADGLRTQIDALQTQLHEAELRLEHLSITRTTITGLADRIPAQSADPARSLELSEHPDYPRILAVFNDTTGPLRARDICQALSFELLPKHVERTRAKMKRLVTLGILSEAEPGTFSKKQWPSPERTSPHEPPTQGTFVSFIRRFTVVGACLESGCTGRTGGMSLRSQRAWSCVSPRLLPIAPVRFEYASEIGFCLARSSDMPDQEPRA
ncbi:hypothetical protein [Streptomyces pseudovenezuelae]|uniref:Uncharacterized protein n=1 Tax=Streptomyces pseudovenezuelae TaxID=67350 RepID=A0ABT6M0R7_9ACTN|nr:hypothetical protein [Streptomyces pseudovenezuelae]MDH6221546.1 hypothetical protein [Streptomyces pseudovenezuelae]